MTFQVPDSFHSSVVVIILGSEHAFSSGGEVVKGVNDISVPDEVSQILFIYLRWSSLLVLSMHFQTAARW